MDEEQAREIAIQICSRFEDLLDEKNIMIPSADRTGRPEEACLYGEEYWCLEDTIADMLAELPATRFTDEGIDYASHPLRQLAIRICDEFEELLAEKDIKVQSNDRTGDEDEACLFGSEYYALEDGIVDILREELGDGASAIERFDPVPANLACGDMRASGSGGTVRQEDPMARSREKCEGRYRSLRNRANRSSRNCARSV